MCSKALGGINNDKSRLLLRLFLDFSYMRRHTSVQHGGTPGGVGASQSGLGNSRGGCKGKPQSRRWDDESG